MKSNYTPNFYKDIPIPYFVCRVELNLDSSLKDVIFSYVNVEFCHVASKKEKDLIGKSFFEIFPKSYQTWCDEFYRAAYLKEKFYNFRFLGDLGYFIAYSMAPTDEEGHISCVFFNIDEQNKKSEELKKAFMTDDLTIRIAKILNSNIPYSVAMNQVLKELGRAIDSDRAYILETAGIKIDNVFEYTKEDVPSNAHQLKNIPFSILKEWTNTSSENGYIEMDDMDALEDENPYLYEVFHNALVSRIFVYPLYSEGKASGFLCVDNYSYDKNLNFLKLISDTAGFISARVANHILVKRLEKASKSDVLTGLLNLYGFGEEVQAFYKENKKNRFVYAVMDIDDFKTINDLYGHPIGDLALKSFSKALVRKFGAKAIIARTGGDEFSIVFKEKSYDNVEETLREFVKSNKHYTYKGVTYPFTVSLGYAIYPMDGIQLQDLYAAADSALYHVKFHSKNDFERYNPSMMLGQRQRIGFSLKEITNNVPGVIFIYQAESGRILYANSDCIRMFDCENQDDFMNYVGYNFKGMVYSEDYDRVEQSISEQIHSSDKDNREYVEYRIKTKKGRIKQVRELGHLVYDERFGNVFYVLVIDGLGNDV